MADDVTFHECMHCKGTGTCTSGKDGDSCAICARRNFILKHSLSEVLAFVGTLTGAVTGFYFSGKRNS
ncbi:hypothetical protein [Vibrio alginolyticus]|uniref:hypothetical protein n=1 Tax=Vibrio alginolyticus TaxID=663 RepID=UPI0040690F1B